MKSVKRSIGYVLVFLQTRYREVLREKSFVIMSVMLKNLEVITVFEWNDKTLLEHKHLSDFLGECHCGSHTKRPVVSLGSHHYP